jgi:hypothetical protein
MPLVKYFYTENFLLANTLKLRCSPPWRWATFALHIRLFALSILVVAILGSSSCQTGIRPETRTLANEIADSTSALMRITDDSEFFRRYIAFNVRFTLRHQLLLNDTTVRKELQEEISKTALVQEAQKRVNMIQSSLR